MVQLFPTLNASLNFLSGVFLFFGWRAVKRGDKQTHKKLMIAALISSVLFLISYITYHALKHGVVTKYTGLGFKQFLYFFILLTHTLLAVVIVPFSLLAVNHGLKGRNDKHTAITRWLLPVWMYVAVTGVLIYLMLYIFN